MSDLDNEELIATRKLHGLDDNLFKIEKEAKTNKQEKELNDLENFAELLRPEQRYYTNNNWNDCSNYDICINSDTFGVEETAELICKMVSKKETKEV